MTLPRYPEAPTNESDLLQLAVDERRTLKMDHDEPGNADSPPAAGESSSALRNSKGWDGKLRVPKSALLTNPEALSDPEYSDDSNVLHGEEIDADEGTWPPRPILWLTWCRPARRRRSRH